MLGMNFPSVNSFFLTNSFFFRRGDFRVGRYLTRCRIRGHQAVV